MKRFNAKYAAYWYHPDHLGSSSYITNLDGEINQHMEYLPFGETLVEEHLNSYNSPFKFNAKELDAETGNYYYGARYYDPKWSLWLSVDPLWEKYPSWSPFAYTFQNSINFIDPDGRSGEPVIDNENKTVTIHSKLYFYGSEANSELSEKIATGIASQWNSANAKTEVEGIEYDVKFRISYETVSVEKAIELAENNKSLKNNFIRVEKGDKNQSSFALASEQGGNSFWFNTNDELESSTTPAHEYGHGLGLPHPKIDLSESADRPHIMIPRNKAYGPYWSIENDKGRRVVNPNARRVTPQNVSDALKNNGGRIHNRIISKDGKLY